MTHPHIIIDSDKRFTIDAITRKITSETITKKQLMQYDHNSERFTFEAPRYVEGHDLSLCNVIQIHYLNIGKTPGSKTSGIYEPDDMTISASDPNQITFSWLISQNATKHMGSLNFVIRFVCTEGNKIVYAWNTDICSAITVGGSMNLASMLVEENADLLESWRVKLFEEPYSTLNSIKAELDAKVEESRESIPESYTQMSDDVVAMKKSLASITDAIIDKTIIETKHTNAGADGTTVPPFAGYIDTTGVFQSTDAFKASDYISVDQKDTVIEYKLIGYPHVCHIAFYDADKKFISGLIGASEYDTQSGTAEIPDNASYVRCSMLAQSSSAFFNVTQTIVKYKLDFNSETIQNSLSDMQVSISNMQNTVDEYKNLISSQNVVSVSYSHDDFQTIKEKNAFVDYDGIMQSTDAWIVSKLIPVYSTMTIDAKLRADSRISSIAFYDEYGTFISGLRGTEDEDSQDTNVVYNNVTIPENAWYLRFSAFTPDTQQYFKYKYEKSSEFENTRRFNTEKSVLYKKTMIATGDSITATVHYRPWAGFAKIIAGKYNMTYDSSAIWGASIAHGIEDTSGCVLDTVPNMSDDADYIILSGGANDCYAIHDGREQLGQITEGYDNPFNESTFCGAMESLCQKAITKWPDKIILFVITHRMLDVYNPSSLDDIISKQIEILNKWGIPFVDLWHNIPSLGFASKKHKYTTMGNTTYNGTGDGLHPNYDGYIKYYVPMIEKKLLELS